MPGIPRRGGASHGSTVAQGVISVVMELKQLQAQLGEVESLMKRRLAKAGTQAGRSAGRAVSTGFMTAIGGPLIGAMTNLASRVGSILQDGITSAFTNAVAFGGLGIALQSEMEQAEVVMQTLLGSMKEGTKLFQDVKKFAIETPFPFEQIRDASKILSIKMPAGEVMKNIKMLGDIASGTGGDLAELAFTYEKVYGSARVLNYSLRQFERRGLPIYEMIGRNRGTDQQGVFELAKKGLIGFKDVEKAFQDMTGAGGRFFEATANKSGTMGGQLEKLKDSFYEMARAVGEVLQPAVEMFTQTALSGLPSIKEKVVELYSMFNTDRLEFWGTTFAGILDGVMFGFERLVLWCRQFNAELSAAPYHALKLAEAVVRASNPLGLNPFANQLANEIKTEAEAYGKSAASKYPDFYSMNKDGTLQMHDPSKNFDPKLTTWLAGNMAKGKDAVAKREAADKAKDAAEKARDSDGKWHATDDLVKMWENRPQIFDRMADSLGHSLFQGLGTVLMSSLAPGMDLNALKKKDEKNILEGGFSSFEDLNRNIQNTLLKDTEAKKTAKNTAKANDWLEGISTKMGKMVLNTSAFSVFGP